MRILYTSVLFCQNFDNSKIAFLNFVKYLEHSFILLYNCQKLSKLDDFNKANLEKAYRLSI